MAPFASTRILCPNGRKRFVFGLAVFIFIALATPSIAQQGTAPDPKTGSMSLFAGGAAPAKDSAAPPVLDAGSISGTVTDTDNDVIPGVTVMLDGPSAGSTRTVVANDLGGFEFSNLDPGGPYYVSIKADGLVPWTSPAVILEPSQFVFLSGVKMSFSGGVTSVRVSGSPEQIATEQVHVEERQRVLGIVPNFYVVYDPNPEPLTTKLKFSLALRAETDPVVFLGAALVSGMDQAGNTPDYAQGAKGYGQRLGANYTTGFTDIMMGGAILPSLLHQDPRYFYQGTGTTKSRVFHALSSPFICKGDNGRWQPNFSSVGGDLAAGAIAETYYPSTNRGPGLVFQSTLITTGGRMANGIIQEFILRKLTPRAKD